MKHILPVVPLPLPHQPNLQLLNLNRYHLQVFLRQHQGSDIPLPLAQLLLDPIRTQLMVGIKLTSNIVRFLEVAVD